MPIKFEHHGKVFEVETPEQAVLLIDLLDQKAITRAKNFEYSERLAEVLKSRPGFRPSSAGNLEPKRVWDAVIFVRFIERLGDVQKLILEFLIIRNTATDQELRTVAGVGDNLALAGVLSGISKQALAQSIPPRAVFWVKNLRSGGNRAGSRYHLAEAFLQIAREMDWPSALHPEIFPELKG